MNIEQFLKDRKEVATLPLSKEKIFAYMKKYNINFKFSSDVVMYASIHKMRLELDFNKEEKLISIDWLLQHGFKDDLNGVALGIRKACLI